MCPGEMRHLLSKQQNAVITVENPGSSRAAGTSHAMIGFAAW